MQVALQLQAVLHFKNKKGHTELCHHQYNILDASMTNAHQKKLPEIKTISVLCQKKKNTKTGKTIVTRNMGHLGHRTGFMDEAHT